MKKCLPLILSLLVCSSLLAQTSHTITASGLNYSPANITVSLGDTIKFSVGPTHPTTQVSQSTWNANGSTPLSGGFNFPSGTGSFVASNVQTYYYICENHISSGMKGQVTAASIGLTENSLSGPVIYPNPVKEVLHFELPQADYLQAGIYDLAGKLLAEIELSSAVDNNYQVDVSALPAGKYILKFQLPGLTQELRFLKI